MKSDILKESGVVERIICDLSEYGDIPNKGFLAGGAVANLLMTYLWEGNYPINDLDIFIESEQDLHSYKSTPLRTNELVVAVSYTHLTLPTSAVACRSRWSPYH